MKIAVGSDMLMHTAQVAVRELEKLGHEVIAFGALIKEKAPWSEVALEVAEKVAVGDFDYGVLLCWTGTGVTMAANKVKGIRAALCTDVETVVGARAWNDANILCMSLRLTSEVMAAEMLKAWLETPASEEAEDVSCIAFLKQAEERYFNT